MSQTVVLERELTFKGIDSKVQVFESINKELSSLVYEEVVAIIKLFDDESEMYYLMVTGKGNDLFLAVVQYYLYDFSDEGKSYLENAISVPIVEMPKNAEEAVKELLLHAEHLFQK